MLNSSAPFSTRLRRAILAIGALALSGSVFANEVPYERVIDLDGTSNTRDIGGYVNGDGDVVRWRQILRSDRLSELTPEDFRKLEAIGVKTVIDLRTEREQQRDPTVWVGEHPPRILHFPIGDARNEWFSAQRRLLKSNRFTEDESLQHMVAAYRMIAEEGAESLRQTMDVVLDSSNWPVLIHCSAGKDRSGVAIALILEALGVDRATIMDDFLLTNEVGHARQKAAWLEKERSSTRGLGRGRGGPSAEAWFPIVGVEPEMLNAFYADVDEIYGSMEAFLNSVGIDAAARHSLTAALTESRSAMAQGAGRVASLPPSGQASM
jgi:protein-tyrosine phosphatase